MALNKPTGDMLNAGSDVAAQDLGTAAAGTSSSYARADHVHKKPTAADVGAVATSQLGISNGVATLGSTGKLSTDQVNAISTADVVGLSAALATKVSTSQLGALSGVATLDAGGKLTSSQIPALTTSQIAQITPAGIGAVGTGDVIAISKGGTGSTTAPAARTALGITPANIGAISTDQQAGFATLTAGTLTTTQALALTGDVTSAAGTPITVVGKIQGKAISNATPITGQTLVWDGAQWAPATSNNTGGGGGANGLTYYFNQATAADAPVTNIPGTPHQLGRSGEVAQTTITTGTLPRNTWTQIAGFVTETAPQDPATILIPAGLWDTNFWCFGDAGTSIRAVAYIYSLAGGGTLTALGSPSSSQVINGTSAQYSLSVLVPQTAVLATDRIYIALEAYATGNNHTVTAQFGDSTPSHIHTSLPLVGGTGLWKNISGALQSPATLLFNADVDPAAAIAVSKISGLAASATTDTTNASNIVTGTLGTDQLASISGLPTGAQGSATVIPLVTVDSKGRVTALTTSQLASYVLTADLTTAATANKVPQLDSAGKLSTAQVPALTAAQIAQITPAGIGAVSTSDVIAITKGGTGAISASAARTSLGITPANIGAVNTADIIAISNGGTGATTASAARTALGITPANIGAISTDQQSGFATLTGGTLTTSQVAAFTGDVTSTAGNPATTVGKIQGRSVSATLPTAGQVLTWNNGTSQWEPTASASGGVTATGTGLTGTISKFASETSITSATAGTDYQAALTTSQPLAVTSGGTGLGGTGATFANGQLLIGNGTGLTKATLTAGSNVTITNASGAITIGMTATPGTGTVTTNGSPVSGNMAKFSAPTVVTTATAGVDYQAPFTTAQPLALTYGGTGQITNELARSALGGIQNATIRHGSALSLQNIGTISGGTWTTSSTTLTFASSSVTLVPGMSILAVGLTSAVIRTVDSPTQVTMSIAATSGGSGTISIYNSTVSTLVSSSIVVMDGRTMVVGDVVLLSAQTANAQNGPWVLNSLAGSVMSFSRPSYWTGTILGNSLFYIQQGTTYYAATASVSGIISTGSSVGVDSFSVYTAITRASNAVVAGNIFIGKNTFQAGAAGSGAVPFSFQAPNPTIMTTPQAHSVEWDSSYLYLTSLTNYRKKVGYVEEAVNSIAFPTTALTVNIETQDILYFNSTSTSLSFSLNVRGNATTTFDTLVEVNKSRSFTVLVQNGASFGSSLSVFTIDSVAVTPKYANANSNGNANGIDAWTFTILKTAAATYTVLVAITRYA